MSDSPPRDSDYPPLESLDDLISKDVLAERLGVQPRTVSQWRFENPPLPYIRFGGHMWYAEPQVVWWINRWQREHPDPYKVDRRRRLQAGIKVANNTRQRSK